MLIVLVDITHAGDVRDGHTGGIAHEPRKRDALDEQLHVRMHLPVQLRQLGMRPAQLGLLLLLLLGLQGPREGPRP